MCLIGIANRAHAKHRLVLAANRDEFHERPAAPAASWSDAPDVFGGRDLKSGGSWLAVSTRGRLAAVTNVRRMIPPNPDAPTRGALVADFVRGAMSAAQFADTLAPVAADYAGFNLLLYDGRELLYLDNHPDYEAARVAPGIHVVSNDQLDTPWPKSLRLHAVLERTLEADPLFEALADRAQAKDAELPDTGVGLELERMLSPPFIVSSRYGTRCSTVVRIGDGAIEFEERRFDAAGNRSGATRERLALAG
ncbi:MAG: NRDE family protein [Gammaproteobacteria bacterium]